MLALEKFKHLNVRHRCFNLNASNAKLGEYLFKNSCFSVHFERRIFVYFVKMSSNKTDFKRLSDKTTLGSKKIESPFAKYNSIGQLTCIVCNQVIKSEFVWNAHLNSKTHLENKNALKSKLIGETKPPAQTSSKQAEKSSKHAETSAVPSESNVFKRPADIIQATSDLNIKKQKLDEPKVVSSTDSKPVSTSIEKKEKSFQKEIQSQEKELHVEPASSSSSSVVVTSLPEGFFDDPEQDAKVRGFSREENLEAEYEAFKKIIQTEEVKSEVIIEKDDTLREVSRELEEVDELINRWTKIENMHQKREALLALSKKRKEEKMQHDESSDESEDEEADDQQLESVLGLSIRNKQLF